MEENEVQRLECEIDEVEDRVLVKFKFKDLNLELVFFAHEIRRIGRTFQKHYKSSDYDYDC